MSDKPIGSRLIAGLQQLASDLKTGKPVRQTIVRRMNVKGETVYTHETFTGPIQNGKRNPR